MTEHDELLEAGAAEFEAAERPSRLMSPSEWREWQQAVRGAALGRGWKCCRILDADMHIRALLAENLQLRQDYERMRAELEPLRQLLDADMHIRALLAENLQVRHYDVLKRDMAEYIKEKERRENGVILARLGRVKQAWWRRLFH